MWFCAMAYHLILILERYLRYPVSYLEVLEVAKAVIQQVNMQNYNLKETLLSI